MPKRKKRTTKVAAVFNQAQAQLKSPIAQRKKRRRKAEQAYSRKRNATKRHKRSTTAAKTASENRSMLAMRTDRKKEVTIAGEKHPLKTTIIIDQSIIPKRFNLTTFKENLYRRLKNFPHFRPVGGVSKFSSNYSPQKVWTPKKRSVLQLKSKMGAFWLYSNDPDTVPIDEIELKTHLAKDSAFFKSEQYAAIKKIQDEYKLMTAKATEDSIKKSKAEKDKRGGARSVTQGAVMAATAQDVKNASATVYTKAALDEGDANPTLLLSVQIPWEWLHLVANMILGDASQTQQNLVSGTAQANTEMLLIESEINYLIKHYPEGCKLEIRANLIPKTHIATTIEYTLIVKDFTLPLVFNAQTPNKPHISYHDYIHSFIVTLIDAAREAQQTAVPVSPAPTSATVGKDKTKTAEKEKESKMTKKEFLVYDKQQAKSQALKENIVDNANKENTTKTANTAPISSSAIINQVLKQVPSSTKKPVYRPQAEKNIQKMTASPGRSPTRPKTSASKRIKSSISTNLSKRFR